MPAAKRARYRKKASEYVVAVQLDLDTDGLVYKKWDSTQRAKRGDWLVNNRQGDTYTVEEESFARTYEKVTEGIYIKTTAVWAEVATQSGAVKTKEGSTSYQAGDYLVSNHEDGSDAYATEKKKFEAMYTRAEE
jgi:hypothetical protein